MNLLDLPPWEQLPYFASFSETQVPFVFNQSVALCQQNNQRILLAFSASSSQPYIITTNPNASAGQGIVINGTGIPFMLRSNTDGILSTLAWYSQSQITITVLEVFLQSWPKDGDRPLKNIEHPVYVPPPPQIVTAPGVKGDQGVMSYWRSVVDRIRGK